jgi:porphobilinogen synthase
MNWEWKSLKGLLEKPNMHLIQRPRRNRKTSNIRRMVCETRLSVDNLVLPLFLCEGQKKKIAIPSMPEQFRYSVDEAKKIVAQAETLGIPAIALFPQIDDSLKTSDAREAHNSAGLIPRALKELKKDFPEMCFITDVALDPYSSDGHDGLVKDQMILNDESLEALALQALTHAKAGASMVAPSDMMDGRIGFIRQCLDENGFHDVGILSYAAKYASSFYGPFRDALGSAPKKGDKKTYQMNPANRREALREVKLDISEGADIVMIKPALCYLDVIRDISARVAIPVAAYNVSGEYAMVQAASERGWIDGRKAMMEMLLSIRRSGASIIFTYFALSAAYELKNGYQFD